MLNKEVQRDKMSSSAKAEVDICCANCGISEVDEVKMEEEGCASKLLRSYSDKCREEHREQDEEECQKQVAKMHDNDLFRQPEKSHLGECLLCFLPMPIDVRKSTFKACCSKLVCLGCLYANGKSNGNFNCPFCREPATNREGNTKRTMERIRANDPAAMRFMGMKLYLEGNYHTAIEYWTNAAELGDVDAHYRLGGSYYKGEGVEKDEEKAVYHYEKAAIGGHPDARHNLAAVEKENGNKERSVNHFIIAANLGNENSMKALWGHYSDKNITKEDLEATLRTHKAAVDAMKSLDRDEAVNFWKIAPLFTPSTSTSPALMRRKDNHSEVEVSTFDVKFKG